MKKIIGWLLLGCCMSVAQADAIQQFKRFIASSNTMQADFVQTVVTSEKTEQATGTLEIARPGKFRWTYDTPFKQIIIGHHKTLWIYDVELAQVTKKSMNTIMSPAYDMLLSGVSSFEKNYWLANEASSDHIAWVRATSKRARNLFRSVKMGFRDNTLVAMELVDGFNQRIVLQFTHTQKNIPINPKRFEPVYPKGVNILPDL